MRTRPALPLLLPLLVLALATGPLRAQIQAGQPFLEQVEVGVVNVDVRATDASGRPVTDLGKGDFELLEDGRPVAITNFEAVNGERLPARPAPSQPAGDSIPAPPPPSPPTPIAEEQRLHLVIYVDNRNLQPAHRA